MRSSKIEPSSWAPPPLQTIRFQTQKQPVCLSWPNDEQISYRHLEGLHLAGASVRSSSLLRFDVSLLLLALLLLDIRLGLCFRLGSSLLGLDVLLLIFLTQLLTFLLNLRLGLGLALRRSFFGLDILLRLLVISYLRLGSRCPSLLRFDFLGLVIGIAFGGFALLCCLLGFLGLLVIIILLFFRLPG